MLLSKPYLTVIVDDQEDLAMFIKDMLDDKYPNVLKSVVFNNPVEAFEYIKSNDVNILISDLSMPELHGQSLLRMVRDLKQGIRTVSVTGTTSVTGSITRFRGGDVAMLLKPFEDHELYKVIDNILDSFDLWTHSIKRSVHK